MASSECSEDARRPMSNLDIDENISEVDQIDFSTVGCRIREVRLCRNLTQEALAERANLSVPYVSHIERARKTVSLAALVRIVKAMDVTVDQLLCGIQPKDETAYCREVQELLADCTPLERRIVWDVATALKVSLQRNRNVL